MGWSIDQVKWSGSMIEVSKVGEESGVRVFPLSEIGSGAV